MRKSLLWLITFFLLLTTYNPNFDNDSKSKLNIQRIEIINNHYIEEEEIQKKLNFLYNQSLFSLDTKKIKDDLMKDQFIDSFSIKKIYPSTLKIIIVEKKPLAIFIKKKQKFYITEKGEIISYKDIKYQKKLPTVFGGGEQFYFLYNILKKTKFPIKKIKSYYFFESGRWDLILHDKITIKLPIEDYQHSLENFMSSYTDISFKNYKIYDYRIKDQLILN